MRFERREIDAALPQREKGRIFAHIGAIDALFRADLDLKSSGGDPKVLLERLVVELCTRPA